MLSGDIIPNEVLKESAIRGWRDVYHREVDARVEEAKK